MKATQVWLFFLLVCISCVSQTKGRRRRWNKENDAIGLPCNFDKYDRDADGSVTHEEIMNFFERKYPYKDSEANTRLFFKQLDFNNDGVLQVEEFYLDDGYQKDCILAKLLKKAFRAKKKG